MSHPKVRVPVEKQGSSFGWKIWLKVGKTG